MADEAFRQIQLKGKQLVFLFMAATVVAVVVFLCGVMVGRGVQGSVVGAVEQASFYPGAAESTATPSRAASTDRNVPIGAQETLTYPSLLEDSEPLAGSLAPAAEPATTVSEPVVLTPPEPAIASSPVVAGTAAPAAAPQPAPRPAPTAPPPPAAASTVDSGATFSEPTGSGFVVQVAAVRQIAQANAMASGLSAKGYPAFVTASGPNFRVRVGKYTDRREAEAVAGRLEQEERFKPWITQ
jgi:cell division septation protein DedD